MAGNLQLYSILVAAINSTVLAEEQQIDVSRASNSIAVDTVAKGYAGESPGASRVEVDIKNAMPQAGFEFDAGAFIASLTPVSVQVIGPGGKTMKGKGFIISDAIRHGVNQEASYEFKMRLPLSLFK